MAAAPDVWASIKAAYLEEGDYAAIAKGRELGVRTLEVIPRIRAWKAEAAAPPPKPEPKTELIVAPTRADASAVTVTRDQQRLAAQLRGVLEHELEEMQGMLRLASSFIDVEHIAELKEKAAKGDTKPLAEYMGNAVKARKLVGELVEKLARSINQAIQCERAVWGLDGARDKGAEANAVTWEAILEELRKPIAPLTLPESVVEFERKLRVIEGGRRGT